MNEVKARPIIIVSGLPRSGTSLMMQMIQAGGVTALTDNLRASDEDNPSGYLEFERVKQIKRDKAWLDQAVGKAVKIIHLLLLEIPTDREYRVIFMHRDLNEVVRSQAKMLQRSGLQGANLPPGKLEQVFQAQVLHVLTWLKTQPKIRTLELDYAAVVADPATAASQINEFLGGSLEEAAMIQCVNPTLYRNRM